MEERLHSSGITQALEAKNINGLNSCATHLLTVLPSARWVSE